MNPKLLAVQSEITAIIAELLNDQQLNLMVPIRLNSPEKEILQAKQSLESRGSDRYTGLINTLRDELDIKMSPKNVSRALRFMDALIKALKTRGHSIELNYSNTYARLFGQVTEEIKLREQTKKLKVDSGFAQFEPLGKLYFCAGIGCKRRWADGSEPIENKLAVIIATLEYDAKRLMSIWEQGRIREERNRELQRIEEEMKKRKADELAKFKDLLTSTKRFFEAQQIREYVEFIKQKAANEGALTPELQQWVEWAKAKANWYDPTFNFPADSAP